jgi:hypothetical protein
MIWYISLIDFFVLILVLLNAFFAVKKWRESKININLFLMVFFVALIFTAFRQFMFGLGIILDIFFGENLSINGIISLIIILVPIQFLFYLKEWRRYYYLPIIFAFYSFYNLYFVPDNTIFRISSIILGAIAFGILIVDGIRSKNGMAIAIAFVFMYGLAYSETLTLLTGALFRLIGVILVLLGTSGIFDKYILIDDEKEAKIKNTWIAKMVK